MSIFRTLRAQLCHPGRSFSMASVKAQDTRPAEHRQREVQHLEMMNYSLSVNEATVHTTGLTYTDFDAKNALPKPWQVMKLLEAARFYGHHFPLDKSGRVFRDYAQLTSDRLTFLVTSVFDMNKTLYDETVPKSPLNVTIQGGYIGTTSLSSIATVTTLEGQTLLSNINQVVSVDKVSRRPMPLPDWWKDKYAKSAEHHSSLKFDTLQRPQGDDFYTVKVARSDMDGNNHSNWSSYVRYSLDALYDAAKHGKLKCFENYDERLLKRMELSYSGESFDGDLIQVFPWESTEHRLHTHIYKEQKLIFQGSFHYFEDGS